MRLILGLTLVLLVAIGIIQIYVRFAETVRTASRPMLTSEQIIAAVRSCDTNGLAIRIGTNINDRPVSYSCGSLSEKERK